MVKLEKILLIKKEFQDGKSKSQIAEDLGLSPETVKWYRKQLLVKFSATTSAELVRKAIMNNIL